MSKNAPPPDQKVSKGSGVSYVPVRLADSPVFVAKNEGGEYLRPFRRDVPLIEGIHYHNISGKYQLNSVGYTELNRVANVNVIALDPVIERNPTTRCEEVVTIPVFGVGYTPTGNMVVNRKTMVFNLQTYLIESIQAKIKAHPDCGVLGTSDRPPSSWTATKKKWHGKGERPTEEKIVISVKDPSIMRFIPTAPAGDVMFGYWIDIGHPEIIAAYNDHSSKQKFAVRIATTIGIRLVLAAHPCIGRTIVGDLIRPGRTDKDPTTALVPVYGYRHDLKQGAIRKIADAVEEGNYGKAEELAGVSMSVDEANPETVGYEDVNEVAEEVVLEEQVEDLAKKKTEPPVDNPNADDSLTDLLTSYRDCGSVEETEAWKAQYMESVNALPTKQRAEFNAAAAKHRASLPEKRIQR
jgi:hypothetical protein